MPPRMFHHHPTHISMQCVCLVLFALQVVSAQSPYMSHGRNQFANTFPFYRPTGGNRFPMRSNHWSGPFFHDQHNYLHEFFSDEPLMNHRDRRNNFATMEHSPPPSRDEDSEYESEYHDNHHEEHNYDDNYQHEKPIRVAVISHHKQRVYKVHEPEVYHEPTVINLEGKIYPIVLAFQSYSSPLETRHHHHGGQHHLEETWSWEEPHTHVHTSKKPVYHQFNELIIPYRNVHRVVKPMRETVNTHVHEGAKGDARRHHRFYQHRREDEGEEDNNNRR